MEPTIVMYRSAGQRVIAFGGLLQGMIAAFEGTPSWPLAFELARRLNEPIVAAYGYDGPLQESL